MVFKGYEIEENDKYLRVDKIKSFNLKDIFECGQAFRWRKNSDGSYLVVAKGKIGKFKTKGESLYIYNSSLDEFENIWFDYFDMGRSYETIKKKLKKDEIMKKAVEFGSGIRILKQDFWEMLISFIISANNRIPMIMKVIDGLSKKYGKCIEFEGERFYTFPKVSDLANSKIEDIEACKAGYRAGYIIDTAKRINEGFIKDVNFKDISTLEAEKKLKELKGVGPKVADCILLFSGLKGDVFPTDVWIKKIIETLYFKREATLKEIKDFSTEYFGELSGIAQQYLFYYARENKI